MSAPHVSSFGITFTPDEKTIYRDENNNVTDKEHARYEVLQRFYSGTHTLKEEIITDLKPKPEQRTTGFRAMVKAAFHTDTPTETAEPEEETHPTSAFRSMLEEASGRNKQPQTAILKTTTRMTGMLRQIDESQFPEKCDPEKCPKDFSRHCRANRPENFGKPCIYITPKNR